MLELFNALSESDQEAVIKIMRGLINEDKRSAQQNEIHQDSLREGDNQDAASEEYSRS